MLVNLAFLGLSILKYLNRIEVFYIRLSLLELNPQHVPLHLKQDLQANDIF